MPAMTEDQIAILRAKIVDGAPCCCEAHARPFVAILLGIIHAKVAHGGAADLLALAVEAEVSPTSYPIMRVEESSVTLLTVAPDDATGVATLLDLAQAASSARH